MRKSPNPCCIAAVKVFKIGKALFLKNGVIYCKQNPGLKLAHNKNIQ
jgi:hypothetical protein